MISSSLSSLKDADKERKEELKLAAAATTTVVGVPTLTNLERHPNHQSPGAFQVHRGLPNGQRLNWAVVSAASSSFSSTEEATISNDDDDNDDGFGDGIFRRREEYHIPIAELVVVESDSLSSSHNHSGRSSNRSSNSRIRGDIEIAQEVFRGEPMDEESNNDMASSGSSGSVTLRQEQKNPPSRVHQQRIVFALLGLIVALVFVITGTVLLIGATQPQPRPLPQRAGNQQQSSETNAALVASGGGDQQEQQNQPPIRGDAFRERRNETKAARANDESSADDNDGHDRRVW